MPTIAPWLNINPADFVKAAQMGAELGQRVAQMRTEAAIARQKIASEEAMNAARVAAERDIAGGRYALGQQELERRIEMEKLVREQNNQQFLARLGVQNERTDLERENQARLQAADEARAAESQDRLSMQAARDANALTSSQSLQDYHTKMADIAERRLQAEAEARAANAAARGAGTLDIPVSATKYDPNPGHFRIPANTPGVDQFLSGTNVNPAIRAFVHPASTPSQSPVLRWNPERGDFESVVPSSPSSSGMLPPPFDETDNEEE